MRYIDILFDAPPGPDGPRFVEVEHNGRSIKLGEWIEIPRNGVAFWALRFKAPYVPPLMGNAVDHPDYYNQHPGGIECIEVIEHMTLNVGTAIKYCWRAGLKTGPDASTRGVYEKHIEDLEKARWYLQREIERIQAIVPGGFP